MTCAAPTSTPSASPTTTVAALIERLTYAPARGSASRRECEADRQAHQHPHRPAVRAPRSEHGAQHERAGGILEAGVRAVEHQGGRLRPTDGVDHDLQDRKSTRLNSSHLVISYAVFCLK